MAIMVPSNPHFQKAGGSAEEALFKALRHGLNDEFYVYHHVPFVSSVAEEGEVDFLIVHRTHGILALECKGKGVGRNNGVWYRELSSGPRKTIRSPYDQAQSATKTLWSIFQTKWSNITRSKLTLTHGHAVAFPFWRKDDSDFPAEENPVYTFDAVALQSIADHVTDAMKFWAQQGYGRSELDIGQFKKFRQRVINPQVNIVESTGSKLATGHREMIRLTNDQSLALSGFSRSKRVSIEGGAGTGKTALALAIANRIACTDPVGRKVLLLCFNKHLAARLRSTINEAQPDEGTVEALNFHALCLKGAESLGKNPEFPSGEDGEETSRFWAEDLPLLLLEAWAEDKLPKFDAIIVDEAQDFSDGWWAVIEEGLASGKDSHLILFHDGAQDIFNKGVSLPEYPVHFTLNYNLRNTKRIAQEVGKLSELDLEPHPRCPEGEHPKTFEGLNERDTINRLERLIRGLLNDGITPEQIVLLTPHTKPNSSLRNTDSLADTPVASDPERRADSILHSTIGAFKGLESDVVIVIDVNPEDPRCGRRSRYVAASRARHRLYVFSTCDWRRV